MVGGWRTISPLGLGSRSVLGIDLRARSVRVAELGDHTSQTSNNAIKAAGYKELPAGLNLASEEYQHSLNNALQDILSSQSFSAKRAIVTLPHQVVYAKNIRLPKMPIEELDGAVRWEAEERMRQYFHNKPFSVQYLIAGEVTQGKDVKHEVIAFASDDEMVEQLMDVVEGVGLTPVAVEPVPCSLGRLIPPQVSSATFADSDEDQNDSKSPGSTAAIVIDVQRDVTHVLIADQGQARFYKSIAIGYESIDSVLANARGIDLDEAIVLRETYTHRRHEIAADEAKDYETQLRDVFTDLSREIGLCLRYYSVTFRGERPAMAQMLGPKKVIEQLSRIMPDEAGIQGQICKPISQESVDAAIASGVELLSKRSIACWANAIGASRRESFDVIQKGAA